MTLPDRLRLVLADADDVFISKLHQVAMLVRNGMGFDAARLVRIPIQSGHRSGLNSATIPTGIRPAFRFESGHHSGESGPLLRA